MKILIIDERPLYREGLQFVLTGLKEGLTCTEASGLSNVRIDVMHSADLVFLDLAVSGSKGIESLVTLQSLSLIPPIVILSSEDDPYLIAKCIRRGVMGFIPKSSQPTVLIAALRQVLAGRIYLPCQ